tara:strand:- start:4575 stop:5066 length:492 start_codon:yes stop_codon:yes gene_type:complete
MSQPITITQGSNTFIIQLTSNGNLLVNNTAWAPSSAALLDIGFPQFNKSQLITNNDFDKYSIANRNYVDERFKLNYSDKYWRTVSDKLFSTDPNIEYIAKIKEVVLSKYSRPLRMEYDILEIQSDPSSLDRDGNSKKTFFHHKNMAGSNYIIETNKDWSFSVN